MSNQKQKKAKRQAKRESMQRTHEEEASLSEETSVIDEVIAEASDQGNDSTKAAVEYALAQAEAGADIDPRLLQLFKDFKRYRIFVIAIVAVAFGILALAMTFYNQGRIDEDLQNQLLIYASLIMLVVMAIIFGRVRPIREDINAWNKVNTIALKESGGKHGATKADVDKILARRARNRRIPPTPEFKRIRRAWLALVVVGGILMVGAIAIVNIRPGDITLPLILIVISWGLLMVAMIIERSKMKPLREAWAAKMDAEIDRRARKKK